MTETELADGSLSQSMSSSSTSSNSLPLNAQKKRKNDSTGIESTSIPKAPVDDSTFDFVQSAVRELDWVMCDEELMEFLDDNCIKRFIRANDGDAALAVHQLNKTLKWRKSSRPQDIVCEKCELSPFAHNMRIIGFTKEDRSPAWYTCFGQAHDRFDADHNMKHFTQLMERTTKLMKAMGGAEHWTIINHFEGFGFRDANPKNLLLSKVLLDHYPERLGHVFMIDAPMIFNASFRAVKPLLNNITISKIHFVNSGPKLLEEFERFFDDETCSWLVEEMRQNQDATLKRKKKWWEWQDDNYCALAHDPRAAPPYLRSKYYEFPCLPIHVKSRVEEDKCCSDAMNSLSFKNSAGLPSTDEECEEFHSAEEDDDDDGTAV